jgi:Carboxypeptidase regulatory-like domain/TonB dependent receptor
MKRVITSLFCVLFVFLLACSSVWAQATAQISGTVKDQSGAVLPGVEVTATQTETGVARTTISNETGSYVLPNLPVGPYKLEASLSGFRTFVQTGIVLQVNTSPVINPVLEIGQVSEQVEVQADAALVETRSSSVGLVMDNQRIRELPLNGRNLGDLITLSGAAVQTGTITGRLTSGAQISIGGGVPTGTDYSLDGANHINFLTGVGLDLPFPDATQEFKVETGGLSANRGSSSAVAVVTKSGTNEYHGDLFEFVRNDLFNARSYFSATQSSLKRNQFGGTIGGPIAKNKLFFFGGYQGTRLRSDPADTQSFVPTSAMLAGDWTAFTSPACNAGRQISLRAPFAANNTINPAQYSRVALYITNKVLASLPVQPNQCGLVTYPGAITKQDQNQYVAKIDWQKSDKHSMFGRLLDSTLYFPNGLALTQNLLRSGAIGTDALSQSYAFGDTYLIGASTVQSFRVSINKIRNWQIGNSFFSLCDAGATNFYCGASPTWISGSTITGGFNFGSSFGGADKEHWPYWNPFSLQLNDDVSIIKGNHQMSFGGGFLYGKIREQARFADGGQFSFNGAATGQGLADFMTGRVSTLFQGQPNKHRADQHSINGYATDTWKVTSRLVANLGVRWDPYLPQSIPDISDGIPGAMYNFDHTRFIQGVYSSVFKNAPSGFYFPGDPNFPSNTGIDNQWWHFTPRVGFAWDVRGDGHTSVRASYTYGYVFMTGIWREDVSGSNPWGGRTTVTSPPGGLDAPWLGISGGNPFPYGVDKNAPFVPRGLFLTQKEDMKTLNVYSSNVAIQQQFGKDWLLSASYIGTRTLHVWGQYAANPAIFLGTGPCTLDGVQYTSCSTAANTDARRLLSLERPRDGDKIGPLAEFDDGGQQRYNGLLLSLNRRVASGLNVGGNYTWSHCQGNYVDINQNGPPANETYSKPGDRNYDNGNCLSDRRQIFNATAVAVMPRFANRTVNMIASNWTISGIYRVSSGAPISVVTGGDQALSGTVLQRPNQVAANPYKDKSGRPLTQWVDPAAFTLPTAGTYGNVGWNSLIGPGTWSFDMSLSRAFNLREMQRLEVRAEAFNVTNSFRPGCVQGAGGCAQGGIAGTPAIGGGVGTGNSTALSSNTFGQIRNALEPRILQFAIKYVF